MARMFLLMGCLFGFLAVALGAFGAHGLESKIAEASLAVYKTGVLYQMFHVMALFVVAGLCSVDKHGSALLKWSGYLFVIGIVLFSGSLYLLSVTGIRILGIITPFGGLAFLVAWSLLFYKVYKQTKEV